MTPLATEPVTMGEGFAFFRWHSLRWQFQCTCALKDNSFCYQLWRDGNRGP